MAALLSESEFADLRGKIADGRASVTATRSLARQFFTHVGNRNVVDVTGQSVLGRKLIVLSLLFVSLLLILGCLGLIIREFGWVALFAVPLTGTFWTVLAGFTTELGSWLSSTLLLITVLVVSYFLPVVYILPVVLFTLSLYLYRIGHILAQSFLLQLVTSSYDAYDMLAEHLTVTESDAA